MCLVSEIVRDIWGPRWASQLLLPALLQKLVGEFFFFLGGNFGGNLSDPQNKGSKKSGEISEHFSSENSCLETNISCQLRSEDVPP